MWTLVGAGIKSLTSSARPMASLIPSKVKLIKDQVQAFEPKSNSLKTSDGTVVSTWKDDHLQFIADNLNFSDHV